jgi:hypothetical protein
MHPQSQCPRGPVILFGGMEHPAVEGSLPEMVLFDFLGNAWLLDQAGFFPCESMKG